MAHITDYRVRVVGITLIFTERPARSRYKEECTIKRGKSTITLRAFVMIPGTFVTTPRTSGTKPRTYVMMPGAS